MAQTSRRAQTSPPRLTKRSWEEVASGLEDFLRKFWEGWADGIPPGWGTETTPTTIEAGDTGSTGTELNGWAAADHEHPVTVDTPSSLANANTEGTATTLVRSDHQHKRDVRVKLEGGDIGTRNALNFLDSGTVDFQLTDDAVGDEVEIVAALQQPLLLEDGSASAPTYSFANAPSDGMWWSSAGLHLESDGPYLALNVQPFGSSFPLSNLSLGYTASDAKGNWYAYNSATEYSRVSLDGAAAGYLLLRRRSGGDTNSISVYPTYTLMDHPLYLPAGSFGTPSLVPSDDTDTGLYWFNGYNRFASGGVYTAAIGQNAGSGEIYNFDSGSSYSVWQQTSGATFFLSSADDMAVGTAAAGKYLYLRAESANQMHLTDGTLVPESDNDVALGSASLRWSNVHVFDLDTYGQVTYNDTYWDDLRVGVNAIKVTGSNQPTWTQVATNGAGSNGVYTWAFSPTGTNEVWFEVQLPHGYKEGTDIQFHVHWMPSNTDTGNVLWRLEYVWANINATFGNTTMVDVLSAGAGTANTHTIAGDAGGAGNWTLSGTGKTISSILLCRLARVGGDASDTFTGSAYLLSCDFHYQIDTPGSDDNFTK